MYTQTLGARLLTITVLQLLPLTRPRVQRAIGDMLPRVRKQSQPEASRHRCKPTPTPRQLQTHMRNQDLHSTRSIDSITHHYSTDNVHILICFNALAG